MESLEDFNFQQVYTTKPVEETEDTLTMEEIEKSRNENEISLSKIVSNFLAMQTLARTQASQLLITK